MPAKGASAAKEQVSAQTPSLESEESKEDKQEEIPVSELPVLLFDMTGSHTGDGDISGPLHALFNLRDKFEGIYHIFVDKRAIDILIQMYATKSLKELETLLNVKIWNAGETVKLPKADFVFQLFAAARNLPKMVNPVFSNQHTATIIAHSMHEQRLSEIRVDGHQLFFKSPGMGIERSGILKDPNSVPFLGKSPLSSRLIAADNFEKPVMKNLLLGKLVDNPRFSFFYGAHNEAKKPELVGQTKKYLKTIGDKFAPQGPIFIFTPHEKEQLKIVGVKDKHYLKIVTLDELGTLKSFVNQIYVVTLGHITGKQFSSLVAIADFPILVEGNNAIGQAMYMKRPFLMYRSPWNTPNLNDILELEHYKLGTSFFSDIYHLKDPNAQPSFSEFRFLQSPINQFTMDIFYGALSVHVRDFSETLLYTVQLVKKIREISTMQEAKDREASVQIVAQDIALRLKDLYLEYSFILNATASNWVSKTILDKTREILFGRGLNYRSLENKFLVMPDGGQKANWDTALRLTESGVH